MEGQGNDKLKIELEKDTLISISAKKMISKNENHRCLLIEKCIEVSFVTCPRQLISNEGLLQDFNPWLQWHYFSAKKLHKKPKTQNISINVLQVSEHLKSLCRHLALKRPSFFMVFLRRFCIFCAPGSLPFNFLHYELKDKWYSYILISLQSCHNDMEILTLKSRGGLAWKIKFH